MQPQDQTAALLVFSDLDGTLLDHGSYSWQAAAPALGRLRAMGAGLILASSKTAAEIAPLRAELGFAAWPAIVENGAGLLPPGEAALPEASAYDTIRALLPGLPPGFRGFGDIDVAELADLTGLSPAAARAAKARAFTEPGLWTGPAADLPAFLSAARAQGLHARRGGRFLTLSFGATKADQMAELIRRYRPRRTLALGDAPNDVEMLEAADHGVIVANPHAPPLPPLAGEDRGRITRTTAPGPAGWNAAVIRFLTDQDLSKDASAHG
ncbi:MAG: HAD hydrolase family protein [Paracoccaceae bacterium]